MRLLIRGISENIQSIVIDETRIKTYSDLLNYISKTFGHSAELAISSNGRNLKPNEHIQQNLAIYDISIVNRGGKGGFGSLLKGQPPVKKRTNNFDSCRDLSGRRMRHVNQEKMLKDWQQKKLEEEKLLRTLNNPSEEENVKNYIDSDKRKEVLKLNKKYLIESVETAESVSDSIKFLMKKKQRQDKEEIEEKVEIRKIDYPTNNKKNKKNRNNNINLDDIEEEKNIDKEELEKELFYTI